MIYKFFDKNSSGSDVKCQVMANQELAKESHQPIIRKFENRKVRSSFIDNIWDADPADMQLISTFNKGFRFFYYALLIFIANMHVFFVQNTKMLLQLLMLF